MNRYIITSSVNTKLVKAEDVIWAGASQAIPAVIGVAPFAGIAALAPLAAVAVARDMKDTSITKITSLEQLSQYKNCISPEWKPNVIYVEHPHRQNVLIEASLYKDYILREMVSDVANYISDHLDLSKMVIGLITSGRANAKVNVPVQEVNADATLKCNLDKNYIYSVNDTRAIVVDDANYVWMGLFPDIVSAVEHQAGKMEIRKKISMNLDVNAGLGKGIGGAIGAKKDYEFYVTYVKAKQE